MLIEPPSGEPRALRKQVLETDLCITGGGMAGVCCAITAARAGIRVVLVQDRPVLGGNASSEVRLWILGATSHMGNNNRWAREGGVIDEILVENLYRNPEGNPYILDSILLEKVAQESNITLLLNAAVHELDKSDPDTISAVLAFCPQNSTMYEIRAPLFCDASGDGIVGFLAGAAFRMGAESTEEFGEKFAPTKEYGELLGHSMYFYSKDTGRPVKFIPPSFALADITRIPRFRQISAGDSGCRFWWFEYGGRMDTVHDTEAIKWELWKVVYGVWNYIKNSGKFPEAQNLALEWVGTIPGKRESRRFEGDAMLIQQDLIQQRRHDDAVSFGGWAIDLHPADGVFSEKPGCSQWHSKGVYQIPWRCMYSRNIRNLFLAGRIISASHVAFGSTRVMATCAHGGQAVGMAAALCRRHSLLPRDLARPPHIGQLQLELIRTGQYIPHVRPGDPQDLAQSAAIAASSEYRLSNFLPDGPMARLDHALAMMLPVSPGPMPKVTFVIDAARLTQLRAELRISSKPANHTPDTTLATRTISLRECRGLPVTIDFGASIDQPRYAFICLMANPDVAVRCTSQRVTGVLSVAHKFNAAVAKGAVQSPEQDIGVESFEFWVPQRRPGGHNLALHLEPALAPFSPANVASGIARPTNQPNAWVADPSDPAPRLTLQWSEPRRIGRIELSFDTDFDHPAESVLMGHPESIMPFVVQRYRLRDGKDNVIAEVTENHQTRNALRLPAPIETTKLVLEVEHPSKQIPAAVMELRCYEA